jgi:hypothetical protein
VHYAAEIFTHYASHRRDVALGDLLTNYETAAANVLAECIR